MVELRESHRRWTAELLAAAALLMGLIAPAAASAGVFSSVVPFLLKPGDVPGVVPGKAQVFTTASGVRNVAGERPTKLESERLQEEGFVEAAIVRLHDRTEPAAKGVSSVIEFETTAGASSEMKVELKEEIDRRALREEGILDYWTLRRIKVPGVPDAVAYAFKTNKTGNKLGIESGIAKGLFIEGNCMMTVGIYRPASKKVTEPVISAVQAISTRTAGACP